jgi:hypothetical protein
MARTPLCKDFRRIDPRSAHIVLAEMGSRPLATFSEKLSESAKRRLMSIGVQVESLVAEVIRRGGWKVREEPDAGDGKPDLFAEHGGKKYVIEIKRSSEGRKDRLIPLVSQAILQAREGARHLMDRISCWYVLFPRRHERFRYHELPGGHPAIPGALASEVSDARRKFSQKRVAWFSAKE